MNHIQPPSIVTENSITVFLNGKPYSADNDHPNFDKIIEVFNNEYYNQLPDLFNIVESVKVYANANPDVVVDEVESTISYKGNLVHNSMVSRILTMMGEGFDITPMTNLLANLYSNVSKKAIDELYDFLEYGKLPITPDGYFLAYKRVNENYTSCYDHRTDNSIGNVVSMERNEVDDRSEVTCSNGLHICSFDYLAHYSGAKVIVVKVNPADVVSIPTDYDNTKARVCRYEVIGELTPEEAGLDKHSFGTSVWDDTKSQDDEDTFNLSVDSLNTPVISHWNHFEWSRSEDDTKSQDDTDEWVGVYAEFVDCDDAYVGESRYDVIGDEQVSVELSMDAWQIVMNDLINTDSLSDSRNFEENTKPWVFGDLGDTDRADEIESIQQSPTRWYKVGYSNGFADGKLKNPKAATLHYSEYDAAATEQDIIDWNDAYKVGYSDGKGHKKRQYPKTGWFD